MLYEVRWPLERCGQSATPMTAQSLFCLVIVTNLFVDSRSEQFIWSLLVAGHYETCLVVAGSKVSVFLTVILIGFDEAKLINNINCYQI